MCAYRLNNVKKVVRIMLIMLKMLIFVLFLVKIVLFTLKIIYIMKIKKTLIKVVPSTEIVGTSWHDYAVVRSSLNDLLKVFKIPFSKVDVSRLTDKTRYNLYLKVDGMPAFSIYDRCHFQYGVKIFGEEDVVIDWHIGTFSDELAYKVCKYLSSLGLSVACLSQCSRYCVSNTVVDDLPF